MLTALNRIGNSEEYFITSLIEFGIFSVPFMGANTLLFHHPQEVSCIFKRKYLKTDLVKRCYNSLIIGVFYIIA